MISLRSAFSGPGLQPLKRLLYLAQVKHRAGSGNEAGAFRARPKMNRFIIKHLVKHANEDRDSFT